MSTVPGETGLPTRVVLSDVAAERRRQDSKWGQQSHPDGIAGVDWTIEANLSRAACEFAAATRNITWTHIFLEEAFEAIAESDPAALREELIQVAAVATAWVEDLDRRARS